MVEFGAIGVGAGAVAGADAVAGGEADVDGAPVSVDPTAAAKEDDAPDGMVSVAAATAGHAWGGIGTVLARTTMTAMVNKIPTKNVIIGFAILY
jgi:hypothetical protein